MRMFFMLGGSGVGKTTLSVELAKKLQDVGRKVCVMGLYPQHHARDGIQMRGYEIPFFGLYTWPEFNEDAWANLTEDHWRLAGTAKPYGLNTWQQFCDDVDIILSKSPVNSGKNWDYFLPVLAPDLITMASLAEKVEETSRKFDDCVIDCPPNRGVLAMFCAGSCYNDISFRISTLDTKDRQKVTWTEDLYRRVARFFEELNADGIFLPVMSPSLFALDEVMKIDDYLLSLDFRPHAFIFNQFPPSNPDCEICSHRVKDAEFLLRELRKKGQVVKIEVGDFTALSDILTSLDVS